MIFRECRNPRQILFWFTKMASSVMDESLSKSDSTTRAIKSPSLEYFLIQIGSCNATFTIVSPYACYNWSEWSIHGHMTWYILTVSLLQATIPLATNYYSLSYQRPNQRPDQRHERHAFNYVWAHNFVNSTPIFILRYSACHWQYYL